MTMNEFNRHAYNASRIQGRGKSNIKEKWKIRNRRTQKNAQP